MLIPKISTYVNEKMYLKVKTVKQKTFYFIFWPIIGTYNNKIKCNTRYYEKLCTWFPCDRKMQCFGFVFICYGSRPKFNVNLYVFLPQKFGFFSLSCASNGSINWNRWYTCLSLRRLSWFSLPSRVRICSAFKSSIDCSGRISGCVICKTGHAFREQRSTKLNA